MEIKALILIGVAWIVYLTYRVPQLTNSRLRNNEWWLSFSFICFFAAMFVIAVFKLQPTKDDSKYRVKPFRYHEDKKKEYPKEKQQRILDFGTPPNFPMCIH